MCSENWCESEGVSPHDQIVHIPSILCSQIRGDYHTNCASQQPLPPHTEPQRRKHNQNKKKECDAFVSCEFLSTPASHAGAARTALGVAKLLRFVQWSAPLNVQGISLNEPCDAGGYLKREITSAGLTRPTFKPMCREK